MQQMTVQQTISRLDGITMSSFCYIVDKNQSTTCRVDEETSLPLSTN